MSVDEFQGKWNFVESDNFESYLKAAGVSMLTRKAVAFLKPTLEFEVEGEKMKMKTYSTFKNTAVEFELGKEFDETTGDGRKCKTMFTFSDGKLHQLQKALDSELPDSTFDRYIKNGQLVIDMECNGVKARRVYAKAAEA